MTVAGPSEGHRGEPAWWVVAAGVCAALHVGKLSPALPILGQELGVTLVQAGFLLSLVQLAGLLFGLAVGLTADTLGLKRSMVSGLLILSMATMLGGFVHAVPLLLVLRGFEGLGFLLVSMPAPSLIRQLVPTQRMSTMLGVWGAYMPLGTALALLAGPAMIAVSGWRSLWWILSLLSLLMAIVIWRRIPGDRRRARTAKSPLQTGPSWTARLTLTMTSAGPWLVALTFAMYSGQWMAVIGFLPTVYADAGYSGGLTAVLTATVAAINMIGNISSGRLLARGVPPQTLLYVGFGAMGLGTLLAFMAWPLVGQGQGLPPMLRFFAVALFSMVGGMIPGTLFSLAVRVAPNEGTISTTVGWMQQWAALGQFAGPPLVGWMASLAGGWQLTWVFTGACSIMGAVLAVCLGRRNHQ